MSIKSNEPGKMSNAMEVHVARKYKLGYKIGSGSFGVIHIGELIGWLGAMFVCLFVLDLPP